MKVVTEFKRGTPIPYNAKYISSREDIKTIPDKSTPYGGTIEVERYWIDIYEVFLLEDYEYYEGYK